MDQLKEPIQQNNINYTGTYSDDTQASVQVGRELNGTCVHKGE